MLSCSGASIAELEHLLGRASAVFSAAALANILQFLCVHGIKPTRHGARAVCDRLAALLLPAAQAPRQPISQALALRTLCKIAFAVAGLRLGHPGLLRALVPALSEALALLKSDWRRGSTAPSGLSNDLVLLASALAELRACGLLHTAGSDSSDALLHLWQDTMAWIARSRGCAAGLGAGEEVLTRDAAVQLELSVAELECDVDGSSVSGPAYQNPSQLHRLLATAHSDG